MKLPSLTSSEKSLVGRPSGRRERIGSRSQFSALEGRTLYSADLGLAGSLAVGENNVASAEAFGAPKVAAYSQEKITQEKTLNEGHEIATDVLRVIHESTPSRQVQNLEVVLIDSRVPDIEALRSGFQTQIDQGRNLAIIVVNADSDGILRTTQMLSFSGQKVSALHIISHGQAGQFSLGSATLTSENIEKRSADLASWSQFLSNDADILIYGCELASKPEGQYLLSRLGELTGSDIAASTNLTGAKDLGGDWDLEYHSGVIEASVVVKSDLQSHWQHLLAGVSSGEVNVNQNLAGDQLTGTFVASHKTVAMNDSGDIAVTWQDQEAGKVLVRLFHPDGSARTNEISVFDPVAEGISPAVDITRAAPVVAVRADGSFIVSWVQRHSSISDKIHAQRYTAEGIALGSRIDVDGLTTNNYLRLPDIAVDDNGGFVISYQVANGSGIPDNGNYNVKVSGFNSDGSARFTNIQAGTASTEFEGEASVAVKPNGSFIVAWTAYTAISGGTGIYAQRFNADGSPIAGQFLVNTSILGNQYQPHVAAADDGRFTISYTNERYGGTFPNYSVVGSDIVMRSYAADGSAMGGEVTVADASKGVWNSSSSVAMDPAQPDHMLVVWQSSDQNDKSLAHIEAQSYNGLGGLTGLFDVTSNADVNSGVASVATNGNLVAIDYSSLPSTGVNPSYEVHLVTYTANPLANQAIAPANMIPLTQVVDEDGTLSFTLSGLGNALQIGDSDSNGGLLSVSISIPPGTGELRIASPTSVSPLGSLVHFGSAISGTTLSFQGTVTELNQALAQLQYIPGANFNGPVSLQLTTTELYGATPQSDADILLINVAPVNDPISVTIGSTAVNVNEGIATSIGMPGLIQVSDIDANSSIISATISGRHGFVNIANTTGSVTIQGIDYMDGSDRIRGVSILGTLADVNKELEGLRYQSDLNFIGVDTLSILVSDEGNTGSGGATSATANLDVNVIHVNLTPTLIWAPSLSASVNEDSSNPLSTLFGIPALSISDSDAGTSKLTLSLSVSHGQLQASVVPAGLVYAGGTVAVDGPLRSPSFNVEGTISQLNAFIASLNYASDPDFFGTDTLTVQVDDQQGSVGSKIAETRSITISPVNDMPSASIGPMILPPQEDVATRLGDIFANIRVDDIDAGAGEIAVTVQVNSGTLHLDVLGLGLHDAATGLPLSLDLNGSSISFKGSMTAVNAALPGILFQSAVDSNGPGNLLSVKVNDLGNGSLGGTLPLMATSSQSFEVQAINDAPSILIGNRLGSVTEDTPVRLASLFAGASGLSIEDVDAGSGMLKLTVSVSSGLLSLDPSGLTLASAVPDGSTLVIQASLADLNLALQRVMFTPSSNAVADVNLQLRVDDLGNSGQAPGLGNNGVAIAPIQVLGISAVNDLPIINFGTIQAAIQEDVTTALGSIVSSIVINDVDAGSNLLSFTLTATRGTLKLDTTSLSLYDKTSGNPLSGVISGTSISFKATEAVANSVLPQVLYKPNSNANGTGFGVTISVDDLGNTGSPNNIVGPVSKAFSFAVSAVNDAPVNTAPLNLTSLEDTPLVFNVSNGNRLSISDPDGNVTVEIRLQTDHGLLSLNSLAGLNFSRGDGVSDADLVFTGTVNNVNSALNGLVFRPDQDFFGSATLNLTTNDKGNLGAGGAKSAVSKLALQIQAVNDLPSVQIAKNLDLLAGTSQTIDGSGLSSIDVESDAKSLVYTLDSLPTQGTLFLSGKALVQGDNFTQENVNKGSLSYQGFAQSNGTDQINLTVRDADLGVAPLITLSVNINQNPSYSGGVTGGVSASRTSSLQSTNTSLVPVSQTTLASPGSTTQSTLAAPVASSQTSLANASSSQSTLTSSASSTLVSQTSLASNPQSSSANLSSTTAAAKSASEATLSGTQTSTQSGAPTLAATPAVGSTSGSTVGTAGPSVAATSATARPIGNAPESAAAKENLRENAFAALSEIPKTVALSRQDMTRLAEFAPSPLPLGSASPTPQTTVVTAGAEIPSRPTENENPTFVSSNMMSGINLPPQAPIIERIVGDGKFQKDIEKVREDVMAVAAIDRSVVASTIGVSASFTIGYILWLVRGGVLISSLLASLPAWKMVDPLPILGSLGKGKNDDESLEEMLDGRHQAIIDEPDPLDPQTELRSDERSFRQVAIA